MHAVIVAAALIDPAAELALRLAAVAGARRAELAALQWGDVHDGMITIDSAVEIVRRGERRPGVRDAPTKTANVRTVALDADTLALIDGSPGRARAVRAMDAEVCTSAATRAARSTGSRRDREAISPRPAMSSKPCSPQIGPTR